MAERGPLPWAALGFACAAVFSSWNPLSAPFGLVLGLASLVLGVRAMRRAGRRGAAAAAVAAAGVAIVASVLVLALTAGIGRDLVGTEIVPAPSAAEVSSELDAAAERTREARERARKELEALEGAKGEGAQRRPGGGR